MSRLCWVSQADTVCRRSVVEGEIADADIPLSKKISASTVGFPLLSKTCLPFTFLIFTLLIYQYLTVFLINFLALLMAPC